MTHHMAQGLYMEFYFRFSGITVKVEVHELDGNQLCMATELSTELSFCENKIYLLI